MHRSRITAMIAAMAVLLTACGTPRTTPDIDLPTPPDAALLVIPDWSGAEVRSICLEVSTEGELVQVDQQDPAAYVTWILEGVGALVVSEGCDAMLSIDIAAERIGARYTGPGGSYCYQGYNRSGTGLLSAPGRPDVVAEYERHRDPPGTIGEHQCVESSEVTGWPTIFDSDSDDHPGILRQLLGDQTLLLGFALAPGGGYGAAADFAHNAVDPLAPFVIDAIIARLAGDDRGARVAAAQLAERIADINWRDSDALLPVVPYLIWALAEEDAWEVANRGEMDDGKGDMPAPRALLGKALEEITNEEMAYRADLWWDWWQSQ